jgi:hypothetical protein
VNAAKLMRTKNKLPVVLILVKSKSKNSKYPFDPKTALRLARLVAAEHADLIIDVVEIDVNSVDSVISKLHPKYQPILWGTSKNRMNDYLLQMDFAKNKRITYNISRNFKLIELPINVNSQKVIDLVRNDDFRAYKEYVPRAIHSEFFNLRADAADK